MDNFIVRWYNQNRKMIWIVILTIVAVIGLIQILDNYYKNNPKDESSGTNRTTAYNAHNYSIVTQEEINETTSKESIDLIGDFFWYCNNGQVENAYNLISAECKQELYPTIEDFKNKYHGRIFTEQKKYNSMLWIIGSNGHTYRVEIMADLLATGQKDSMPIEDYYTIIYENGEYKLNISSYIGREEINVSKTQSNIIVNVLAKKIYMDYETYEIEVQNNTENKLIFNTKENTKSIYIQDENEIKHIAFLNELTEADLEVLSGLTKTLKIKFNRGYKPTINIEKVIFEDVKNNGQTENIEIHL